MGYTACERLIKGDRDMIEVEKIIVRHLGGENHRCAFFRSVPYIRLRIAALYLPSPTPHVAYCGDLSVVLTLTDDGPLVSVGCSYEPTYPDDFHVASSVGLDQVENRGNSDRGHRTRKRMRGAE